MTNGDRMGIVVHNKSSAFFPLITSFINLIHATRETELALRNPAEFLAAAGDPTSTPATYFDSNDISRIRRMRNHLREAMDEERVVEALHIQDPKLVDAGILDVLDEEASQPDVERVRSIFHGDDDVLRQVSLNQVEWSNLSGEGASIHRLSDRGGVAYSTARRLGFRDVIYVEEFPMVIANVGHKSARNIEQIRDAVLQPNETQQGRVQVYSETFTTEAILFMLDQDRLREWVEYWTGNEIPIPGDLPPSLPIISSVAQEQMNIRSCDESRAEHGIMNPIGHYLFTLLHTLSHASMLASSIRSGFHINSLGEYLSPGILGYYIYVNKMYESGLGGLENLFSRDIEGVLHRIESQTIDCIHDPHCRNRTDSACHACVVVSETSCRQFNSHLDRKVLHGDVRHDRTGYLAFRGDGD